MGDYFKDYTKKPMNAAQYTMMRGVTDFTNAEQLNMYESGHSLLVILDKPKFLTTIAEEEGDNDVKNLLDNFCNILEYEFKGLDGLEDITAEDLEFTDGVSTIATIGKVNEQSNSEVTMGFTEKSGSTITKFIRYYLDGVRDSRTQMKTYHGLIEKGKMALGFENEVFNLLYIVTDPSGLGLEAAYLLANAWPNSAKTTIYESEKGTIEPKQIDVTFKCFVLRGEEIDKRALKMLAFLNKTGAVYEATNYLNGKGGAIDDAVTVAHEINTYDAHQIEWASPKFKFVGIDNITEAYGSSNQGNDTASKIIQKEDGSYDTTKGDFEWNPRPSHKPENNTNQQ